VAVEAHHAQMSGALAVQTDALVSAVAGSDLTAAQRARTTLIDWCRQELLPHATAEEQAMYPAARATVEGRLLVDAMLREHGLITDLVRQVENAEDLVRAAAAATALRTLFESHLEKENELVLPLLVATPRVSVAELLGGMHELLGESADQSGEAASSGCGGHTCSCGEQDADTYPELDARAIPHAIRHATIFGALETVPVGSGLVLLAPHDPIPLLGQIGDRWPGEFDVEYLETGPDTWRLQLTRGAPRG
jgi:uncharacterized protein (DUF2249 family)/hemerythrin-like domain-containing protein